MLEKIKSKLNKGNKIEGDEVDKGTTNEPLLKNVRIIQKLL